MKQQYNISSDGTWLSTARAEWLKTRLLERFPGLRVDISCDDSEPPGEIAFRIIDAGASGTATTGNRPHAFVHQGELRNVAVFHKNISGKLQAGESIMIAASAGQQFNLIKQFLQRALPKTGMAAPVVTTVLAGGTDVEAMLRGETWDGIIVPLTDLDVLLQNDRLKKDVTSLLSGRKTMVLPLFEVPPVAGQAALVVYTDTADSDALLLLKELNNDSVSTAVQNACRFLEKQGDGINAGAFYLDTGTTAFTYAAGLDKDGLPFTAWDFEVLEGLEQRSLFASTDYMKDFFTYDLLQDGVVDATAKAAFISSHKAIHSTELTNAIAAKKVWAAGTRTWYELAKKGIWVEGCADGLGLEFLASTWKSPMIELDTTNVQIITNASSAEHWVADGWNAVGTYELLPSPSPEICEAISKAEFIFWTSFQQYEQYKGYAGDTALHGCPAGKTAKLLMAAGLQPVIYPTIKAFNDWRAGITKGGNAA